MYINSDLYLIETDNLGIPVTYKLHLNTLKPYNVVYKINLTLIQQFRAGNFREIEKNRYFKQLKNKPVVRRLCAFCRPACKECRSYLQNSCDREKT